MRPDIYTLGPRARGGNARIAVKARSKVKVVVLNLKGEIRGHVLWPWTRRAEFPLSIPH